MSSKRRRKMVHIAINSEAKRGSIKAKKCTRSSTQNIVHFVMELPTWNMRAEHFNLWKLREEEIDGG